MAAINVLDEILMWSSDRPIWQRDALRRLVEKGELDETDINELTNLCKSHHGLRSRIPAAPLSSHHLPQPGTEAKPVSLVSLTHHTGVNALAQHQKVEFGPQLTIVYGGNAAGKSGYTRILKRVCRARGAEEILGNVMAGSAPGRPSATIEFKVDGKVKPYQWDDRQRPDAFLSKISVFDRHCASVYLAEPTDVAFRPLGLDLFDKLADACGEVRRSLEEERSALEAQKLQFPSATAGTAVHELVTSLTSLTKPALVTSLASLTDADKARAVELLRRIRDLQSDNPEKTARTLELRADRVNVLINHFNAADEVLSDAAIQGLFNAHELMHEAMRAAENLHRTTFHKQPLKLTGSNVWRTLWNAAARFSTEAAYPEHPFPFTGDKSRCVLCQQILDTEGAERLQQFQEFFQTDVQADYDRKTKDYDTKFVRVGTLADLGRSGEKVFEEIRLDDPDLAKAVRTCLDAAKARKESVTGALTNGLSCPEELPEWVPNIEGLTRHIEALKARANELRGSNRPEVVSTLKRELNELEARQLLADHLSDVLGEIERKKRIAAYQLCIADTRTNAITIKSSDVTTRAVTQQLTSSFEEELTRVEFHHVEVQMVAAGGARGVLRHKLQFRRAPGTDVVKVVSDGEARCLSIASFFAELSTAAEQSAILFDDPVSSLDHMWRRKIAERLADEAKNRQVIVFTHDIYFLHTLTKKGKVSGIEVKHQYLRRDGVSSGLCSEKLPWVASKVRTRIGYLKDQWQAADAAFRNEGREHYEMRASYIYGLLREAWERGVEEVLLGGLIERYDPSVQTKRARYLTDICDDDITALEAGMNKCSQWLPGHDSPRADSGPLPNPEELLRDIEGLEKWVAELRPRR